MTHEIEVQYRDFENTVKRNMPNADMKHIRDAFEYAYKCHGDQKRKSGEPYIIHPLAAAQIIAEMGLDEESVIAAPGGGNIPGIRPVRPQRHPSAG